MKCLRRWSKSSNKCPICRETFEEILCPSTSKVQKIHVDPAYLNLSSRFYDSDSEEEPTCAVCYMDDSHETFLECHGGFSCPNVFHPTCLSLPSSSSENFVCAECSIGLEHSGFSLGRENGHETEDLVIPAKRKHKIVEQLIEEETLYGKIKAKRDRLRTSILNNGKFNQESLRTIQKIRGYIRTHICNLK